MKLMCISCMKREEVLANTIVKWFYKPEGGQDVAGRLEWNGSADMQDVSISVLNISLNDSGIYTCNGSILELSSFLKKKISSTAGRDLTALISAIMMYILLVFLTLWLLIEMVYCYRKVSKAEEATQEN
ncbi:hypothetical protein E2320_007147, partial [Naja naja]